MKAGTHDRFSPRGELTPEQLKAYAEGRLDKAARREVELHLEQDPLARDAAEGLMEPGALAGLAALDGSRPHGSPKPLWPWVAGAAVVLIAGATWWSMDQGPMPETVADGSVVISPSSNEPVTTGMDTPLESEEIEAAAEIPETLFIGHTNTDRHALEMRRTVEATAREAFTVERLEGIPTALDTSIEPISPKATRSKRYSIQLMYLHDLKLVEPRELYRADPLLFEDERHVGANFPDREAQHTAQEPQRLVKYTPYMDGVMAKFARNDHKGCLEDLRFLLRQYPNDVNALFYAGLCSYNLGMNERAREFLHRAATHPIGVFDEEAVWYHALTLSRLGEHAAAKEAYERIASDGGFYAERASAKLRSATP